MTDYLTVKMIERLSIEAETWMNVSQERHFHNEWIERLSHSNNDWKIIS